MKNEINYNIIDNNNNINNIINDIPRNVKIPFLSYDDNNSDLNSIDKDDNDKIPIFDLNKLFHFNFSYNFEVLKSLLETLVLNQQEGQKELLKMKKDNELKINELENKIIDLKIKISSPQISSPQISSAQTLEELKKEKEKILDEFEKIKKKEIKEKNLPLKLKQEKEKENYKIIIDNLTVSIYIIIFIYIIF